VDARFAGGSGPAYSSFAFLLDFARWKE